MVRIGVALWLKGSIALLALALLALGCATAADATICTLGGTYHASRGHHGWDTCMEEQRGATKEGQRLAQVERACEAGDPESCVEIAPHNESRDHFHARHQYEVACQAKIAAGCLGTARLLRKEAQNPDVAARARDFAARACDLGAPMGCAFAADGHPDAGVRVAYLVRACEGHYAGSCLEAGKARLDEDPVQARHLLIKGCRGDKEDACIALGRLEVGVR